jgi:hypothetical protein
VRAALGIRRGLVVLDLLPFTVTSHLRIPCLGYWNIRRRRSR